MLEVLRKAGAGVGAPGLGFHRWVFAVTRSSGARRRIPAILQPFQPGVNRRAELSVDGDPGWAGALVGGITGTGKPFVTWQPKPDPILARRLRTADNRAAQPRDGRTP